MSAEPNDKTPRAADDAEPTAGLSPAPLALIILFAALAYWAMLYLDDHGGGFSPAVYAPYTSFADLESHQIITDPTIVLKRDGEKVFKNIAQCATCHQENGTGGANGCPPLAGSDWAAGGGPNRIIRLVLNGGSGPITVSGKQLSPSAAMTSFKDSLSDYQIAAVLTYVRSSWGNQASAVTPAQVAKIRDLVSNHRGPWSASELLQIADKDQ